MSSVRPCGLAFTSAVLMPFEKSIVWAVAQATSNAAVFCFSTQRRILGRAGANECASAAAMRVVKYLTLLGIAFSPPPPPRRGLSQHGNGIKVGAAMERHRDAASHLTRRKKNAATMGRRMRRARIEEARNAQ